ncbi:hypothetical protein J2Z79_000195 [Symbiobacterium terraclitae]|uniref:Lipoprotein n=1 Tax=Symbiobacterium terraclitae TaxID=557451 RepID=A0ABS4JMQ3_9FIRM|nr:hypothetical protein [Symbiobacterium terraclitae]MBP2016822.1 hypothetical protein [Symbiobacterium terraclitae]
MAIALALPVAGLTGCGSRTQRPAPPAGRVTNERALTVEEYPIVADSVDKPTHFGFFDRVGPEILAKRKAVRDSGSQPDVAAMNQDLARFGYALRVEGQPGAPAAEEARYGLYRGDELVLDGIRGDQMSPVFLSASGTDWFFRAYTDHAGGVVIRAGKVLEWDEQQHMWTRPVYLGDDLAWVTANDDWRSYRLEREGKTVFEGRMPQPLVDLPFKGLVAWDAHWAVEVDGDVVVDGQSVREANGYGEVFTLNLIKGRPFYLYEEDGTIRIWYDGQTAEQTYDEVVHYRCCEPAAFNPRANDSMVWFWARRGDMWYYVEAGVYD